MEQNLSKSGHFVVDIIADMTTGLKTHLISYSPNGMFITHGSTVVTNDESALMNHELTVRKLYIERKYC